MVDSKPLSFDCMKAIIVHLDVNKRFEIAKHNSSLYNIERSVPLHIDRLYLDKDKMIINHTTYKYGICRSYHGMPPEFEMKLICLGEESQDMDEYGCLISHREDEIARDGRVAVVLRNADNLPPVRTNEEIIAQCEQRLRELNSILRPTPNFSCSALDEQYGDIVLRTREQLVAHVHKRQNARSEFVHYVMLTTSTCSGSTKEVRMAYDKKLYEYKTEMNDDFFKNRIGSVSVGHLEINSECVYQFPVGLKFKVHSLQLNELEPSWALNTLSPILDAESYPLNILSVNPHPQFQQAFDHPLIKSARTLNVNNFRPMSFEQLKSLSNVSIGLLKPAFDASEFGQLAQQWVDEKEVGTRIEIRDCHGPLILDCIEVVTRLYPSRVVGPRSLTIPVSTAKKLFINFERNEVFRWCLKMEMKAVN